MRSSLRALVVVLLVVLFAGLSLNRAYAQEGTTPETQASAAKITRLLQASGHEFEAKSDTVWVIKFHGDNLKNFKVILSTEGDLLVTFVIVAPHDRLRFTEADLRALLRMNSRFDRVKIGLDQDGDLFVREDSSVRILDVPEFKAIIEQISAVTDQLYKEVGSSIAPEP